MALTGDFRRLEGLKNAVKVLPRVPSKIAGIAAPRLQRYIQVSIGREVDAYAEAFAPHSPATTKRWGPHKILDLTGAGKASIKVQPMSGSGIKFSADEKMRFAQGGTKNEPKRTIFPDNPSLPKAWNEILDLAVQSAIKSVGGEKIVKRKKK